MTTPKKRTTKKKTDESVMTSVAKTVGGALGTIVATTTNLIAKPTAAKARSAKPKKKKSAKVRRASAPKKKTPAKRKRRSAR